MVAGMLGDRFGRKRILIIAAFMFFVSAFGSMIPLSFQILIPARLIGGVGVGMASVLAPLYISKFSLLCMRARLVFKPDLRIALIVGISLSVFGQLSRVNIVV